MREFFASRLDPYYAAELGRWSAKSDPGKKDLIWKVLVVRDQTFTEATAGQIVHDVQEVGVRRGDT